MNNDYYNNISNQFHSDVSVSQEVINKVDKTIQFLKSVLNRDMDKHIDPRDPKFKAESVIFWTIYSDGTISLYPTTRGSGAVQSKPMSLKMYDNNDVYACINFKWYKLERQTSQASLIFLYNLEKSKNINSNLVSINENNILDSFIDHREENEEKCGLKIDHGSSDVENENWKRLLERD